jgi:hypothetical protein
MEVKDCTGAYSYPVLQLIVNLLKFFDVGNHPLKQIVTTDNCPSLQHTIKQAEDNQGVDVYPALRRFGCPSLQHTINQVEDNQGADVQTARRIFFLAALPVFRYMPVSAAHPRGDAASPRAAGVRQLAPVPTKKATHLE